MPSKDCLRLDEGDGAAPTREQTGREKETKSVDGGESWTGHSSAEHHELVAKQGVFQEEFAPAAHGVDQRRRHLRERREIPPDCGGAVPDADEDPVQEVEHPGSSAWSGGEPKSPGPGDHGRRMGRVASTGGVTF